MTFINSLALLAAAHLTSALPAPEPNTAEVLKRQDPNNRILACTANTCSDCPLYVGTGSGYPECNVYNTDQFKDKGYPVEPNGQLELFFDVPELDPGCQVIVQTPVTPDQNGGCGGNVLVARGATCAPVRVDQTFDVQFCCGTGDCSAAGVPTRRSPNPSMELGKRSGAQKLVFYDRNGTAILPQPLSSTNVEQRSPLVEERDIEKRSCKGFTATNGPYTKAGPNIIISDEVTCGPTQPCYATESKTVETSFSVDVGVSVSDPFGIISASIDITWEKSVSRSFSAQFEFGAGETGYVEFIPILTCVDGYFTGNCGDSGKQVTACAGSKQGNLERGDIRGVVVRG